jgi:D-alanyl-D-alanine carboxypeptidase (penicillin-binding protein 5/6)
MFKRGGTILKRVITAILFLVLVTSSISYAEGLNLTAESAILIDMDTGQILYEKNPHLKLHPASTTKIMTGILAIENGNLNDVVTVDEETPYVIKGSHIALEPGEKLTLKDLLYALLIESANDSALVIAKHIAGTAEEFAKMMNDKAKELGALNTNFINPHGLTNENHLTTAYDLSLIARYAMKNETFREIVSNYTYTIPPTNKKDESRYLKSHNELLYSSKKIAVDGKLVPIKYEGATGIKTGYTTEAGNCLVASAERNNKRLIAVVLKSRGNEMFSDIHKLFNYGFENFEKVELATRNEFIQNFQVKNGKLPIVPGVIKNDFSYYIPKDSIDKITQKIEVDEKLRAPIQEGQIIGKVNYFLDGKLVGSADIVSTISIEKDSVASSLEFVRDNWYVGAFLLTCAVGTMGYIKQKRRKRKKYRRTYYNFPI